MVALGLTLPNEDDVVTLILKGVTGTLISRDVGVELRLPELLISRGRSSQSTTRMPMPVASMDEDHPLRRPIRDVGCAR